MTLPTQDWEKQRKIETLPGTKTSPTVFLARLLEMAQAGKIINVAMSIQWEDGSFDDAHMEMKSSDLLYHAHILMDAAHRAAIDPK